MTNLLFTAWMLLYPLASTANSYLYEVKLGRRPSEQARALSAFLEVVTWLGVGYLLYGS